jgi:mitochondrial inner membrane protease ATP23
VQVAVCSNVSALKVVVENTLTHELVHAYDHCRSQVDWSNPKDLACSEIRAANLSGDCTFMNEVGRGHFKWKQQYQACVKRRAALSVRLALGISDEAADSAVEEVFDRCYRDTRPFDRTP